MLGSDNREGRSPPGMAGGKTARRFKQRTETAREREVMKHLLPWSDMHKFEVLKPSPLATAALDPKPCPDTTLLAFAQLAALRLGARRAFISLLSTHTTYLIAEATRTMSFQHQSISDERDRLWMGSCCVPRQDDLSSLAMDSWCTARELRVAHEQGHYHTQGTSPHWQIVSDLRDHPEFKDRPVVRRGQWARFYFAVPLRSAQGSVIGAFSVIDDRPRWGVEAGEMSFMEDIADTIVEHLHATVVRAQRQRSERLIQALGLFNRGKDSLREWWLSQEDDRYANAGRHANHAISAVARQAIGDIEFGRRSLSTNATEAREDRSAGRVMEDARASSPAVNSDPSHGEDDAESKTPGPGNKRQARSRSGRKSRRVEGFDIAKANEQTYARASNLIREALGACGVAFVDARAVSPTLRRSDSGDSEDRASAADGLQRRSSSDGDSSEPHTEGQTFCKLQGFSARQATACNESTSKRFDLPESYLQHLVKRYPQGHVFNFSETGGLSASSSDGEDRLEKSKPNRFYGARLRQVMPDARTIAFYPIAEDNNEHWRSATFAWSNSAFRMFDEIEDLTYLSSFGHSLVSELSRLETLAADQAKGKFISSISHELRSPLHGVLAGVEFLQETDLSMFQREMTHTIQKAGQTLLDTVNHLLDFSKISNFSGGSKKRAAKVQDTNQNDADTSEMGVRSTVDLARLTEDLVESVASAHRFEHADQSMSSTLATTPTSKLKLSRTNTQRQREAGNVSIILKLVGRKDWTVVLQPGSWTRVVTNLVGNALKYTARGSISVSLSAGTVDDDADESTQLVSLVVEDTGAGISEKFLNSHLYTPFAQEDSNSIGTGLGLSIVKQIARDMGATLHVTSKVGRGTRVTFDLNLAFLSDSTTTLSPRLPKSAYPGALNAGSVRLRILEPSNPDEYELAMHAFPGVRASVLQMGRDWLGCPVTCGPLIEDSDESTIFAISEEYATALARQEPPLLAKMGTAVKARGARLLLLGCSIRSMSLNEDLGAGPDEFIFVHQPIGPQKLVRAVNYARHASTTESGEEAVDNGRLWSSGQTENRPPSLEHGPSRKGFSATNSKMPSWPRASHTSSSSDVSRNEPTTSSAVQHASKGMVPAWGDSSSLTHTQGRVLLVEDNAINMKLLMALMRKLNLKYECADNGREALDMYREAPLSFPLILMDLSMPVMDGNTATAKIRELEKARHLRRSIIVALTGLTDEDSRQKAYSSGVDDFQTKPIHMKDLKKFIDSISI